MTEEFIDLLILLVAANGAPIVAARVLRSRGALAIDRGVRLGDGRPVFGPSKTWRGVAAAVVVCCALAVLLGYGAGLGLVFGALVMAGDLLSSFIKRRLGLESSARCLGLDQLPESFIPSLYAVLVLGLPWWWAVPLALTFMLLELVVSRPLFWLRIRKRPY